jgi:predicted lipoprotein with Yx(FWY)xxD motif
MRTSGWAAATGLGSLVLLLAACGGSSSTSNAAGGAASGSTQATAAAGSSAPATTTSTSASASATSSSSSKPTVHHSVGPQPSESVSFPPVGTTVMIVQKSAIGYILAEANGQVVYTYSKDTKNGKPTCTGSCATTWPAVTGVPKAGPADTFPGTFGVVKGSGGAEQITYEGMPLYRFAGAKPLTTKGNGLDGEWHVVKLSESDISS